MGANDPTLEKFTVTNPWRRPRPPHRVVAPVKKKYQIYCSPKIFN
jgi:hypothetical protein